MKKFMLLYLQPPPADADSAGVVMDGFCSTRLPGQQKQSNGKKSIL